MYLLLLALFLFSFIDTNKKAETMNMTSDCYLYISDTAHGIAIYKLHPATGEIDFMKKVDVSGQPGSLTVDPAHSCLYAAIRSTKSISSWKINSQSGDLTPLNTIPAGMNPVFLRTDRTGKFLFSTDNNINIVSVFAIGQSGAVQEGAIQSIATANFPHSVQIDPGNRFIYVPCRSGERIQKFNFDPVKGTLSANVNDLATPDSTGPRHFDFHSALHVVYFVNEFGRSVTVYRIDSATGTLSPIQALSVIPPGAARPIAPNKGGGDIHLTPDNRYLYATNRDPDTITAFSVDSSSGLLTRVVQYPTESTPRAFDIDPTGNFIYVGGQTSGKLAAYRIDSSTGQLTHIKTYDVGESLVWVLLVRIHPQ